ncbi:MAG TPA: hypothetical protein VG916_11205, partial [Gemmatimonadaceae bacterium]|nr:hypothetical protein [Gemmatimonadaceae bacterium]
MSIAVRVAGVLLLALGFSAAAFAAAGTGASGLYAPLSLATIVGVPLAAGVVVACAFPAARVAAIGAGSVGVAALAAAIAVTAGWLPVAWFRAEWIPVAGAALAGGVAGALMPTLTVRAGAAAALVVLSAVAGRFVAAPETAAEPVVVASQASVAADGPDAWQEVVGSDDLADSTSARAAGAEPGVVSIALARPREREARRVAFSDGATWAERIAEWDDDEHLRVVSAPAAIVAPRGLAAWRAGTGESWIVPAGATYDLAADGDSAADLTMRGTYRLAVHANAFRASWLRDAARRRQDAVVATIRRRAEARASAGVPPL